MCIRDSVTTLAHSSGEWIRGRLKIGTEGTNKGVNPNQALGSSISYMRRYALAAIVGVIQDDDDDASSSNGNTQQRQEAPPPRTAVDPQKQAIIAAIQKGEETLDLNEFERRNSRMKHLGNFDLGKASIQKLEKFREHLLDKWRAKVEVDAAEAINGDVVKESK